MSVGAAIDDYETHGRVDEGTRDELIEAIYRAWREDVERGKSVVMIAGDIATVDELNRRARADRVAAGLVVADGLTVAAAPPPESATRWSPARTTGSWLPGESG